MRDTGFHFTATDIEYLISVERKLNTNPTNLQYEGNAIPLYNSYTYCTKLLGAGMTDSCDDLEYVLSLLVTITVLLSLLLL